MKKPLIELVNISAIFPILLNKHYVDYSISFKLAKFYKEIESGKNFYMEQERKLVEKYALKDKDGNVIIENGNQIKFESLEITSKFNKEISKLQLTEIDIPEPIEIAFDDFEKGEQTLSPIDLIRFDGYVNIVEKHIERN